MSDRRPHRSPSQYNRYLTCPKQFAFIYVEGMRMKPSGVMKQGTALHKVGEANNRQKVKSRTDLSGDDAVDIFKKAWKDEIEREETTFDEQTPAQLQDQGVALTQAQQRDIAPLIQPASIESIERKIVLPINVELDGEPIGYDLLGVLDVIDEHQVIRDLKAMAPNRVPDQIGLHKDLQLSTYTLLYWMQEKKPPAGISLDVVAKTSPPRGKPLVPSWARFDTKEDREIARTHVREHLNDMGNIERAIQHRVFPRRTDGWHCSKKFCGFWGICVGRNLVTVDMGANLEQQLKDSVKENDDGGNTAK